MAYIPDCIRRCGFANAAEVRRVAKNFGRIIAPMMRSGDLEKKLIEINADIPIEF